MALFFRSIKIPKNVVISLLSGGGITNKLKGYTYFWIFGIFGYIKKRIPQVIFFNIKHNWLFLQSIQELWLLSSFKMLKLLILGLSKGFSCAIKVIGVGFKLKRIINKNWLMAKLGFSHTYRIKLGISEFKIFLPKRGILSLYGHDRQYLKNLGVYLRSFRKPDIYKLKGIIFLREFINVKAGKKEQV